jgi:predicted phosphodiesterase
MNRIRIVSDLHLEMCSRDRINKIRKELFYKHIVTENGEKVNNLALLGDIGDPTKTEYRDFIQEASCNYRNVFLLAGNHEYYSESPMMDTNSIIRKMTFSLPNSNVHFLNNQSFQLDDRLILGSTLWSEIQNPEAPKRLNDFHRIHEFTSEINNNLHKKSVKYLSKQLKDHPKSIVLSHHAPLMKGTSNPIYECTNMKTCFATDLSDLVKQTSVWAFGHTHWQCDFIFEGSRVVSNPIGYPGELKQTYSVYI